MSAPPSRSASETSPPASEPQAQNPRGSRRKARSRPTDQVGKAEGSDSESCATASGDELSELCEGLSYNQARTALDLTIARLQSSDLEVEEMAGLYRRAMAYADRCQHLLAAAEQEVIEWENGLGDGASPLPPA